MKPDFAAILSPGDLVASAKRLKFCAEQQLFKHAIPLEFGGWGDSFSELVENHYALGFATQDPGLILSINAHLWGAIFPLIIFGSPDQQQCWLPGLLSGQLIAGHAITEPDAGSDTGALNSQAILIQDGWLLNGTKRYITNCPIADLMIVYAVEERGLSAFIVTAKDPGVQFCQKAPVTGCLTAPIGEVLLNDCLIPAERRLGKSGAGGQIMQSALEVERAFIFAGIAGVMARQLETVIQYSRQRRSQGKSLGQHQAISHKIAEMKVRLDTVLLWVRRCAELKDAGKRLTLESAQTKLLASEAFLQSSLDTVQILGASGLLTEQPFSNFVQDALASRLFSGSSEIQKNIIAGLLGVGVR